MRKRSSKILALLIFTIGLAVASRAAAQDNATKADDKKFILEGKVIDDQVVDERGKLVAGALVNGICTRFPRPLLLDRITTSPDGRFQLPRLALPLLLQARTRDGRQIGLARVTPEQKEVTIRVGPTATAIGRLVDQMGKPVMLGHIRYAIHVPEDEDDRISTTFSGGKAILDSDGRFTLSGLVPGEEFELCAIGPEETTEVPLWHRTSHRLPQPTTWARSDTLPIHGGPRRQCEWISKTRRRYFNVRNSYRID